MALSRPLFFLICAFGVQMPSLLCRAEVGEASGTCPPFSGEHVESGDGCVCPVLPASQRWRELGDLVMAETTISLDQFRGIPDGSWQGNTGVVGKTNFSFPFRRCPSIWGVQVGASAGIYDWSGRGVPMTCHCDEVLIQGFSSLGVYRYAPPSGGVHAALLYDTMYTSQFGLFGGSPLLGQMRGLLTWGFGRVHELGVWGTCSTQTETTWERGVAIRFQAINQINATYRYRGCDCSEAMVWVGAPWGESLMQCSGRPGRFCFGCSFRAPLWGALYVEARGAYMAGRGCGCLEKARNYAANASVGLTYLFGGCSNKVPPALPVANNSVFFVDTDLNN